MAILRQRIVLLAKIIISSYLLLTGTVNAAPNQATGAVSIVKVHNWGGGGNETLWIQTEGGAFVNPAICQNEGWYILPDTVSDISRSMILGAKLTQQEVSLTIYGGGCTNDSRPTIVNVSLP